MKKDIVKKVIVRMELIMCVVIAVIGSGWLIYFMKNAYGVTGVLAATVICILTFLVGWLFGYLARIADEAKKNEEKR